MKRIATTTLALAVAATAAAALSGGVLPEGLTDSSPTSPESSSSSATNPSGAAARALDGLTIKGPAPMTGYDREGEFGPAYSDDVDVPLGNNGCDTRNDLAKLRFDQVKIKPGTNDCVVASGQLEDPYSGTTIPYASGEGSDTHLEHVVALGDAWRTGAQQFTEQQRENLANDPLNLLMVKGSLNMAKGDANIATWQPPNKAFRCDYAARQIAVKAKYDLWIVEAEKQTLATVLETCPGQKLPTDNIPD